MKFRINRPPNALDAFRTARAGLQRRMEDSSRSLRDTEPIPLDETFAAIKNPLLELGLFHESSLVHVSRGSVRVTMDGSGGIVDTKFFDRIAAPLALYTSGPYSREYAKRRRKLKASTDDMAQMFGAAVPVAFHPDRPALALLIADEGFLVTGRYPSELVAAAILLEKGCRTEVLGPRVGKVHHLPKLLAATERAVYLAAYSKIEKEAHDA